MPIDHRVCEKRKTVFIKAHGNTDLEELIDISRKVLTDPKVEKGYNRYIDFSEGKPSFTSCWYKIKKVAEFIVSNHHLRGACKFAIYAPSEDAYSFSDLFRRLTENLKLDARVFRSQCEAKQWLGI
jgi:predicted CopG family antitoxin